MGRQQNATFQEALEVIETLPEYQQEDLVNIVHKRLLEKRRESLAENIREAREEYVKGEVKKGSTEDIMKEITG